MVGMFYVIRLAVGVTLALALEQPVRSPLPEVISARVIGDSVLTIKPCEPANVLLQIELERPVPVRSWMRLVHSMSRVMRMDGVEYRNRLSSEFSTLNDAGEFALVAPPWPRGPETAETYQQGKVLVHFWLNMKARCCLFGEAGHYQIDILAGDRGVGVEVNVQEATPIEREIVEAITNENVLFFLLAPTDRQLATPEVLAVVERLAREDTDYKKWLSLSLGLGLHYGRKLDPRDERSEEKELALAKEVYSWLSPHCTGEITSRLEAMATYWCGMHAWTLAKATEDKSKAAAYLAQQVELWRKVADSPYGFDEGARAKEALTQIEAAARAKAEAEPASPP